MDGGVRVVLGRGYVVRTGRGRVAWAVIIDI